MVIVIIDLLNCTLDGVPSGGIVDLLENQPDSSALRQAAIDALNTWSDGFVTAAVSPLNDQITALNATITDLNNQLAEAVAAQATIAAQIEAAVTSKDAALLAQAVADAKAPFIAQKKIDLNAELATLNIELVDLNKNISDVQAELAAL